MDEDELKRRTKLFGLGIIKLVGALPKTIVGKAISGQLVRAGTSVGRKIIEPRAARVPGPSSLQG